MLQTLHVPCSRPKQRRLPVALVAAATLAASYGLSAPHASAATTFSTRIAAGAYAPVTVPSGTWSADTYATGTGGVSAATGVAIRGTEDDALLQRHRWGMSGYRFDVPCDGVYDVTLRFAETVFTGPAARLRRVRGGRRAVRVDVAAPSEPGRRCPARPARHGDGRRVDVAFQAVARRPDGVGLQVTSVRLGSVVPPAPAEPDRAPPARLRATVRRRSLRPRCSASTAPAAGVARVNVGSGSSLTDRSGATWTPDGYFVGGEAWGPAPSPIAGTDDDALFQKNRWGMSGYRVPVPAAGTYRVELRFAEVVFGDAGSRVFDVTAEGPTVLSRFDAVAAAGFATAVTRTIDVPVTDGTLDLGFGRIVEDPDALRPDGHRPRSTQRPSPRRPSRRRRLPRRPAAAARRDAARRDAPAGTGPGPAPPPAPAPVQSGYPNASNTGVPAGTALSPSGSLTITTPGTVIDAKDVNGSIYVDADNVTIKRTRIRNAGGTGISIVPGRHGILIEDVELDGTGNADASEAIKFGGYTARRVHIHHYGEGFRANGDVLIEDSYAHDFTNFIAAGAHQDAIQSTGGNDLTFRHNTLLMNVDGGNAAIMLGTYYGSNVLVENNIVAGGSYVLYGGGDWGNVRFVNNRISTAYFPRGGYFGVFTYADNATKTGNVWHETGQPVT